MADVTLVVYVNPDVQLSRLMKRNGLSEEDAKWRIASQLPLNEKKEQADEVIDNNGTIEATKEQFHTLLEKWNLASK